MILSKKYKYKPKIKKEGENLIDEETRRIIEEFMDEMGVPCTDYDAAFKQTINRAVVFALEWCRPAFEYWYCEYESDY